ncbi:potassium transporter [Candidatus Endobugula sertula]|uniref:Trk system potassium uptake protein n=1 Tax=Candidatus Endobugula sertula TaxID=62101 RepID=A0A1D2QNQ1_9GAMM|nr:potassium transporter [Candidatus Endobugula sertula]
MHFAIVSKILGILLMLFSITLIPPMMISMLYQDSAIGAFIISFIIILFTGILIWLPVHNNQQELRTRDGFVITALFWAVLSLAGSLPFILEEVTDLTFVDAVFESVSGLTTTGATVITGLDSLPKSILFYRQQLQWLGGIGIIVIAVAILPMLGIGGMQLYRAETPGPIKDAKLTPRITETAKVLFFIYLSLTIVCALCYWLAGMTLFDAVAHAFSTVAIGGFSTHDDSMAFFDNRLILMIAMFFMVLSGINFALHYFAWRFHQVLHYFADPEVIFYLCCIGGGLVITVLYLYFSSTYGFSESLLNGSFELISILTTTGFSVADYSQWPTFLPFMIFTFAFMGGCAGSTAGGIKVMRILMICKQGIREVYRLIHPNAVILMKVGRMPVPDRVVEAIWGFFAVYVISFIVMFLALLATGLGVVTAFSAIGASINNLGPGMGDVAVHYGDINSTAKWILCFAMLLGRLEIFTLLVLLTPTFWRD